MHPWSRTGPARVQPPVGDISQGESAQDASAQDGLASAHARAARRGTRFAIATAGVALVAVAVTHGSASPATPADPVRGVDTGQGTAAAPDPAAAQPKTPVTGTAATGVAAADDPALRQIFGTAPAVLWLLNLTGPGDQKPLPGTLSSGLTGDHIGGTGN